MGGNKKKPTGSSDKGSNSQEQKNKKEETKKPQKNQQQRQKISVAIEESQGMKIINSSKAITPQAVAKSLGVKISVANAFIKSLESKNMVKCEGGYSGHKIYSLKK